MNDKLAISDKKEIRVNIDKPEVFDDVDLLSPEEKAALAEDVDLDGPAATDTSENDSDTRAQAREAAEKTAADALAAEEARKAEEAEKKAAETPKPAAEVKPDAAAAPTAKADETPAKIVPDTAPPPVMKGLSEDERAKVEKGLDKAKKDFQEGAIDYDEYLDARDKLNQQIWQDDMAKQFSSESVETRWEYEQETFLTDEKNDWINSDDVVYSAFAATVNRIMATEEGAVMPGVDLLNKAREEVAARFSPAKPAEAEEQKKNDAIKAAKAKEAAKQPPETLGGKPAAEIDDGVGEFEWLDKLDGEAYEKAIINLSDAQRARYEAAI